MKQCSRFSKTPKKILLFCTRTFPHGRRETALRENIYIKTLTDRLLKRPTPSSPLNLAHAASGECYVRECMAGMCLSENGGGPDESETEISG